MTQIRIPTFVLKKYLKLSNDLPSLIFFLLPKVPINSRNDSSFFFVGVVGGLGDFGRGEAIVY